MTVSDNDDVKRFAALLRKKDAEEVAASEAVQAQADAERARLQSAAALAAAKEARSAAASRLKDLRRGRFTPEALVRAEADYRSALAVEVELESGNRPTWARALPAVSPEPDPTAVVTGLDRMDDPT